MPLYEYRCPKCQQNMEILIRSSSEKPNCPNCGSPKLEKLLSVAASPAIAGGKLPQASHDSGGCGRPQCGSGCMFD